MRLYLDIETIPSQRDDVRDGAASKVKVPGQYKKAEAIERYRAEHADEAYRRTALDGWYGEVVCIGYAVDDWPVGRLMRVPDSQENAFLQHAWDFLAELMRGQTPLFVGHNIQFDLAFLHHRSVVCATPPPCYLPWLSPPYRGTYYCTLYHACGTDRSAYKSLTELVGPVLGEDIADDIDGSGVWDAWQAGQYEAIAEHCVADVERVRILRKRLEFEA